MTVVNLLTPDGELEVLFETSFSARTKIEWSSDSTFSIYVYRLIDYDVGMPGFYAINYNNGLVTIDSVGTYDQMNWDFFGWGVEELASVSADTFLTVHVNSLFLVENENILDTIQISGAYNLRLYKSSDQSIYAYRDDLLFEFKSDTLVSILDLDSNILGIKRHDAKNVILTSGQIFEYTPDFDTLLNSYTIPSSIDHINKFTFEDSELFLVLSDGSNNSIVKYISPDSINVIVSEMVNDDPLVGLISASKGTFLTYGFNKYENISSQVFFRAFDESLASDYKRTELDLIESKLYLTEVDSFLSYVSPEGDSVYFVTFNYSSKIKVWNSSSDTIKIFDAFSQTVNNFFGPNSTIFFNGSFDTIVPPMDSVTLISPFATFRVGLQRLDIWAPGADYKFNISPLRMISTEIITSVSDIDFVQDVKLYPNPTSDFIQIDFDKPLKSISIFDMNGQLQYFETTNGTERIDVQYLASGTYILVGLDKEGRRFVGKFIRI